MLKPSSDESLCESSSFDKSWFHGSCTFQEFRASPVTRKQAIGWLVEKNFALRQFENDDGGFISAHLTISATEALVIPRRLQ